MKTIAFFNTRANADRTFLVYHLALMYARLGVNVLTVDLDPQANLTSMFLEGDDLEPLWPETGTRRTVYGALRPLLDGTGDVVAPYVAEPEPGLGLLIGDPLLAIAEEDLSRQWGRVPGPPAASIPSYCRRSHAYCGWALRRSMPA